MDQPYANSVAHLYDELRRLDLLLQRGLVITRASAAGAAPDEYRGLVISEAEIDAIADVPGILDQRWRAQARVATALQPFDQKLEGLRVSIDARRELSRQSGIHLALPHLAERFALSAAEVDILLLALAPELDARYETVYAYLQDDVTRKRPSVDLALNVICRSTAEKVFARRLLTPGASLLQHRLLELCDESQDRHPPMLRKFIHLAPAVVAFLLDQLRPADGIAALLTPASEVDTLELTPNTCRCVENLLIAVRRTGLNDITVRLIGPYEVNLAELAETMCQALGYRLLIVDRSRLAENEIKVSALVRDAVLWDACLCIVAGAPPGGDSDAQHRGQTDDSLWRDLAEFHGPLLLLGPASAFPRLPPARRLWRVEVEPPDFAMRQRAWERALNGSHGSVDVARLADTFRFGAARVQQAVDLASGLAALRDPASPDRTVNDILTAGRVLTTPQLRRFATHVEPRYAWSDIVLPDAKLEQLRTIAARMQVRHRVQHDWGFGRKLSRGKGLNVLFTGPSGTGKTMAAEILAGALSVDLYQIDLSTVVSKYIGETEKHLSEIFREAELTQSLLFFDEADALFGKRTEVKDAHDRYANIEVNYLLQRVEQFEGIVVLATNLQRNLDDAFLRRMQEVVEFPFPDESYRERMWRGHFPAEAPRASDIDFGFLARQFKFTGGNIKNVVLGAGYLAARESQPIGMPHLIRSTRAEFQKLGKMCVRADFGEYYDLLQQVEA